MRTKKIRGHKRRWKNIQTWIDSNMHLNIGQLENGKYDYCKIWLSPWSNLSITNSHIPSPKSQTRKLILTGLLDIYDSWDSQLKQLNKPYYLKIWLYTPDFKRSQVVCAIDEKIEQYEKTFYCPDNEKLCTLIPGIISNPRLEKFQWFKGLDEQMVFESEKSDADDEEMMFINKFIQEAERKEEFTGANGINDIVYCEKLNDVWIGSQK
jgi:hypothetical protein